MDKETAIEIKKRRVNAIRLLYEALSACENRCSPEEFERIRRGVGLSIGIIDTELLVVVYQAYPEIDDLK
jgi:hypothetical protein